jgi:hypothetical protein
MQRHNSNIWQWIIAAAFICCLLLACAGCKTPTPSLPTNSHRDTNDSTRKELRIDTIYQDRWYKEYQKGDTVFVHDSIDRWRNKYVYIHDSINNTRTDTIYQQIQVEKKGGAFLRNSGIALWILIALFIASVIIGIIIKFAK